MKLFYYKDDIGNFGDDLNRWLWPQLIGDYLDDDDSTIFVGIGTLLNHKLPTNGRKIVFGSGYGYGDIPSIDSNFTFYCVRGPKTAKILNLPEETAVTDSALLLRNVYPENSKKKYQIGRASCRERV